MFLSTPTSLSKHADMFFNFCFLLEDNCRAGRTTDAKGWLKIGGGSRALVGSRGKVGMSERGTQDIPRFGALSGEITPLVLPSVIYM